LDSVDEESARDQIWSPFLICEAFAIRSGYYVGRSGRPDVHRAGLEILRDCTDGKIPISWPVDAEDDSVQDNSIEKAEVLEQNIDSKEEQSVEPETSQLNEEQVKPVQNDEGAQEKKKKERR